MRQKFTREDITEIRITRRTTIHDRTELLTTPRPYSEVHITARGETYYTRLFHTLDDSGHAREAQAQDFLRRQNAPCPHLD